MFSIPFFALSQDVDVEDNKILVDKKEYAGIEKDGCKSPAFCQFNVTSLSGKKVLVVVFREYKDIKEIKPSNPNGRVIYYEFIFLESKKKAEIAWVGGKTEKVAKAIVKEKLFKDGELDEAAVEEFVTVNGTNFSDKRPSF